MQWWVVGFLTFLWGSVLSTWVWEVSGHPIQNNSWDTFLIAGYAKCCITLAKYIPQVFLNKKRQSTVGWSLANVLLDLTGGLLSFAQIFINALALGQPVVGAGAFNLVKFILSITSIFFDVIFLIQHYILYPHSWKNPQPEKVDHETSSEVTPLNKTDQLSASV